MKFIAFGIAWQEKWKGWPADRISAEIRREARTVRDKRAPVQMKRPEELLEANK